MYDLKSGPLAATPPQTGGPAYAAAEAQPWRTQIAALEAIFTGAPTPTALFVPCRQGALVLAYANAACVTLWAPADPFGRAMADVLLLLAPSRPDVHATLCAAVEHKAPVLCEAVDVTPPGPVAGVRRYFTFVLTPVSAEAGTPAVLLQLHDVSGQVLARQEAERNEAHFRTLADSLPQIVWTALPDGTPDYFNARWYAFTGLEMGHSVSVPWLPLLHPDDGALCDKAWQASQSDGRPYQVECRLKDRLTGQYRWFLTQVVPIYDTTGEVTLWFGSSTDVDKQKRDGQNLEEIFENMNDSFFAIDKHWILRKVNRQHIKATRIPREEQIGENFLKIFLDSPESRDTVYWAQYHRAMEQRVTVSFEDYYPPLDMWTAVNVYPSVDGGLAVFVRDISKERRLRQVVEVEKQKFEAIFVGAPTSMALLRGADFVFEKANPSYLDLMGGRSILNKPLHVALPELEGQRYLNLMQHVFSTGEPYYGRDSLVRLIRRPGGDPEDSYFDFTYSRVNDGRGNPYGVFIHAIEVTGSFIARQETQKLTDELQDAIRARDDFLSSASHELKTPVTSLKMQLQLTRRGVKPEQGLAPPPTKLARTLDLSCRQVDRLTALIDDLLDVSRIESGKMTFDFEPADLSVLLREAVEQFKEQFKLAGCTVETHIADTLVVQCDSFRIDQVIINLITNAIKYGAGSHITVHAEAVSGGGAQIRVTDQGMGIAHDKLDLVFNRFERAISHNNVSGLGLGLYICKQIIDAHHGTIKVESELGKGSTFAVDLPGVSRSAAEEGGSH